MFSYLNSKSLSLILETFPFFLDSFTLNVKPCYETKKIVIEFLHCTIKINSNLAFHFVGGFVVVVVVVVIWIFYTSRK